MRPVLASMFALLPAFAVAGETEWQQLAPEARARLISSDTRDASGRTLVGIEIDMPESVKTYWYRPGETGLPTAFDLAGSTGIAGHVVRWPYPTIDTSTGYLDFAYFGPTVLPIELTAEAAAEANISVTLGICSEICVPAQASFRLPLDFAQPDRGHGLKLRQALAEAPLPWDKPQPAIKAARFDAAGGRLEVEIDTSVLDPDSVIPDTGEAGSLFGAPQKSPEPGIIYLPLLGKSTTDGLEGQTIGLTFMTADGAYAQSVPVQSFPAPDAR